MRGTLALLIGGVGLALAPPPPAAADVIGYGGNDGRATGWYADQDALGPDAVTASDFGQLWSTNVTGQVYAQPLVSQGTVFVATEDNNIYGLDAQTGAVRWNRNLRVPWRTADVQCPDINPNMGITGTPVLDPATNTAYFLAKTYASGTSGPAAWFMHAVNVATGAERGGFPVRITGNASNVPGLAFDPTQQAQRPGLLLMDGVVYAAFGGQCTRFPYQGWIVGVTTGGAVRTLWSTTDPSQQQFGGGIWQSGGGLHSDRPGSIVFATGNGTTPSVPTPGNTPPTAGLGVSVVRLTVQANGSLRPTDFFSPRNAPQLADGDIDLGSGAPLALPSSSFGTAAHPRLIVQVGKDGKVFLLDADDLGGFRQGADGTDDVVGTFGPDGGVWSKPTPWGGDGGYVYIPTAAPGPAASGSTGVLHAYRYGVDAAGRPTLSLTGTADEPVNFGSGVPVVTSSGTTSGSAVLWQIQRASDGTGSLRAYDPVPSGGRITLLRSFPLGSVMKFTAPAVDDNRLFVGANGRVLAFGRPAGPLAVTPPTVAPTVVGSTTRLDVTFAAEQATSVSGASVTGDLQPGAFAIDGAPTPAQGAAIPAGGTITYPVRFRPSAVGIATATLRLTTPQGSVSVRLTGRGLAAGPLLTSDPGSVAFGNIPTGTSRSASVTLTNVGSQPLVFGTASTPASPFTASGLPAPGTTLASLASVSVTLTFAPTALAAATDQLVLPTNGGTVTIPLSGTGSTPPALSVSPTTITFADTPVGGWAEASFTVTNTGGSDLTIVQSKPPVDGPFVALTSLPEGTTIPPGQSLVQRVRFAPTAAGAANARWDIGSDGSAEVSVNLTGTGTPNTGIPAPTAGGWIFQGSASQAGPDTVLTPPIQFTAGTAFWPQGIQPVGLRASFDLTMAAGTTPSADGATFAIVPASSGTEGTGAIGGGFGWYGMGGVAVVFNEYEDNSVSIRTGQTPIASTTDIPPLAGRTNRVDIEVLAGRIRVTVGGVQVLDTPVPVPATARVGFTAATGFYTSRHSVANVSFTGVTVPAPVLSATPAALAFGDVNVGATATFNLNVANTGSAPMSISATTAPAAPFTATLPANGTTVAPGTSINVPVRFSPTAATSSSSTITITAAGRTATIPLTGRGTSASGTVLPTPWSGTGWSINGAASATSASVVLTPNLAEVAGAALTTSTFAFDGLRASFDLTIDQGTGADGACFGFVPGTTTANRVGTVGGGMGWSGLGGTAVCFDTFQNGTEPSSNFVGIRTDAGYVATSTAIPALRNATTHVDIAVTGANFTVRVAGAQVLSGTLGTTTGRLSFSAGTGGLTNRHLVTNANVTVGAAPAPVLSVSPPSVAFGSVAVGQSTTSNVVVANTGTAPMTISSTTAPAAPFTATLPPNGTTIAAGASVTVPVTFRPTATGASGGTLALVTSAGSATVSLSGTGTAAPAPVLAVTPTAVAFGSVGVGQVATASVTVRNTGSAPLTITGTVAPTAPFSATLPAGGTTVAAGASITVPVRYAPTAAMASNGSLGFTTNAGSATVTLSGTGTTGTAVPSPHSGTGWQLNGVAAVSGSSVVLTPNSAEVAGNVVTTGTYSFQALSVAFDLTIDQGSGADGACFAMVPASTPTTRLGTIGGGMGWAQMGGTAVCFDTYRNGTGEPSANFVGLRTDAGYGATSSSIPTLRNSTRRIAITVTGTSIVVRIDGTQVLTGTLGTAASGRLVFSAGTGGLTNRHVVANVTIAA